CEMRGLNDEEENPREEVHQDSVGARSARREEGRWAGHRLEKPLIGVPLEVTFLNGAPESAQGAPAPPFDEDLATLRNPDDVRRAERSGSDVERVCANYPVAAVFRWCLGLGSGPGID